MKLPPVGSLHLARAQVENEFPHHTAKVKRANEQTAALLQEYREKRNEMRRLSLELAKLELDLKREIGFNEGMEVPGQGILYWTKKGAMGHARINWMQLAKDLKLSETTLNKYRKKEEHRRFFLKRNAHGPEGIKNLQGAMKEDEEFDAET